MTMSPVLQAESRSESPVRVLVVDDEADIRKALALLLKCHGYEAHMIASPAQALADIARERYDLVLMDLNYTRGVTTGGEGLDLLGRLRAADPPLPIVAMTAWSTVPLAVEVFRAGGFDFVQKPWDNARLLEIVQAQVAAGRARRLARRLEDDARDVQGRILGGAIPEIRGYEIGTAWRFAASLGGDAYEVAPLSGGRLHAAIADVCGKGLPAALLMASLRATLEETAAAEMPPVEACRHVATQMSARLGPARFVSLVYAVLDPATGRLVYVNAGHPPPVLLARDGSSRRLAGGGPVIGLGRDVDFQEETLALSPGDRLVLFTDGVAEATGETGDEFGDGPLLGHLRQSRPRPAAEAAADLLEAATEFGGGALADDATTLVVDVDSRPVHH